ncbi:MAG: complex I subunit 5 family protein, partial [Thermomicrobiales bacterium]
PLGLLWIGALIVACMDGRRRRTQLLALAFLTAGLASVVSLARTVLATGPVETTAGGWPAGVGITLRVDALGVTVTMLSLGVLLAALAYESAGRVRSRTFPALVLALGTGLTGAFFTADVFSFYVFFEISMIGAYVLTSYGERARQLRSALIFSLVNLIGSAVFLFGIVALYHVTGSLDMREIASRLDLAGENSSALIATMIFVAFSIKLGLFPFHAWLPPVYTGTRVSVAAILSGALANIGSYGLLRFGEGIMPKQLDLAAPVLMALGVASILYGGLLAVSRQEPAEVIAYSAIGQVGYVMIAVAIGGPLGLTAAILVTIANAIAKPLLFLSLPIRGLALGIPFAVGAFSVAGIPPAAGFWSKAALVRAVLVPSVTLERVALVALILLGGALSVIYMFQAYQREYWEPDGERGLESPRGKMVIVGALAALVVLLGVWPEPMLALAKAAAAALAPGGAS